MISPKQTIEKTSLFVIVPRLYWVYNPQIHDREQGHSCPDPQNLKVGSNEEGKESAQIEKAAGLLYQYDLETKDQPDKTEAEVQKINCFLFKMLALTSTEKKCPDNANTGLYPYEKETSPSNKAKKHWDSIRQEFINHRFILPTADTLSNIVFDNRNLVLKNLEKILRTSIRIETRCYQRNLVLKKIILESVQATGFKVHQFFKLLAESIKMNSQLMEVLCISPEDLNIICRSSIIR